jgi:hypothetical protein
MLWHAMDKHDKQRIYITNLQVSLVHSKYVQNLLFHRFILCKHVCHALFKHGSHVHDF